MRHAARLCVLLLVACSEAPSAAPDAPLDATPADSAASPDTGEAPDVASSPDAPGADAGEIGCRGFFCDDFEYDVSRDAVDADATFAAHGWGAAKAENTSFLRGNGWLYTFAEPTIGSRVLVMESRPGTEPPPGFPYSQTDYYLQYGQEGVLEAFPANLWIQFATYATPESRFSTRDKTLYPCREHYPCQPGQFGWLFMWGAGGFESTTAPDGGRFLAVQGEHADFRGDAEYPTNASKLFQNLDGSPLLAGVWYDVRLHLDVSGEQGVYQAWVREHGEPSWTPVADWRGGVTADFDWPIPAEERRGFSMLRMPTTVNGPGDSTTWMDDFVMATSEVDLPD
jgi:hypothetical protein